MIRPHTEHRVSASLKWQPDATCFRPPVTVADYLMIGTVGMDPPLRPGPRRVRNRVVPVPRRGFLFPAVAKQPPMSLHGRFCCRSRR